MHISVSLEIRFVGDIGYGMSENWVCECFRSPILLARKLEYSRFGWAVLYLLYSATGLEGGDVTHLVSCPREFFSFPTCLFGGP